MIQDDFIIDFAQKRISYSAVASGQVYTVNSLYSWLQSLFSMRKNMRYQTPILAMTRSEYFLVNGWTADEEVSKYLTAGTLVVSHVTTERERLQ